MSYLLLFKLLGLATLAAMIYRTYRRVVDAIAGNHAAAQDRKITTDATVVAGDKENDQTTDDALNDAIDKFNKDSDSK